QDQTMCIGSNTVIGGAPTANAGQPGYSYQWSSGPTLSDDTLSNPVAFPQSTTQSYITVTDQNGCVSVDSMTVIVSPGPSINIGPDTTSVCPGDSVFFNAGTGFTNYFWSNGSTDSTIFATDPGVYFVAVTDILGCLGRDTAVVVNDAAPIVNIGPDTSICTNATLTLDAGAGFQYSWAPGGQTTQSITVSAANTYTVTVTDAGTNCATVASINVENDTLPELALGGPQQLCPGDSIILDAGAGLAAYEWSTGSPDQLIFVGDSGTYAVTITNSFACRDTDSVSVTLFATPTVDLGPDQDLCPGDETMLDAGPGFSAYLWLTGETTQAITVTESGTYLVVATDANGCEARDTADVFIQPLPVVDLGIDRPICPDEEIVLDAGAGFSGYTWSNGETTQTITVVEPGTYSVQVDENGCVQSDEVIINDNCPGELVIPNVFSPNGDGINDLFDVQGVNVLTYEMSIYDRWGRVLFVTSALTNMWDGRFNGKEMPEGVYFYVINYHVSGKEDPETAKGALTLMR
ncbi:MAG: gliding motility-associated C-terminal domain-containing protein, partial [Bacteroidota bacterium]